MSNRVNYKEELAREAEVLKRIDKVPLAEGERPLSLLAALEKTWEDVGWMGKALHVPSINLFVKPPYRAEDVVCDNEEVKTKVLAMINGDN